MTRGTTRAAEQRRPLLSRADFLNAYRDLVLRGAFLEEHEYYVHFSERYWSTLRYLDDCIQSPSSRLLDIGSGQFALLCHRLFGVTCDVADIDSRYTAILRENDVGFVQIDLTKNCTPLPTAYDVIVMAEVIEHVPRPPHLVFRDLFANLRPGGWLVVTTPNLYRLRNLVRMASGIQIFDYFRFPQPDQPIGHFLEYSLDQITWHIREAGLEIDQAQLVQLDFGGATMPARMARRFLRPLLRLYPLWRDSIVIVARKPSPPAFRPEQELDAAVRGD